MSDQNEAPGQPDAGGRLDWRLSEDRNTVEIAVTDSSGAEASVRMDAAALEKVLAGLGQTRSGMLPEVPKASPLGQKFEAVFDPAYWTEPERFSEGSLLLLRHPGFGWQAFVFPRPEADKIQGYFANHAAAIKAEKVSAN